MKLRVELRDHAIEADGLDDRPGPAELFRWARALIYAIPEGAMVGSAYVSPGDEFKAPGGA